MRFGGASVNVFGVKDRLNRRDAGAMLEANENLHDRSDRLHRRTPGAASRFRRPLGRGAGAQRQESERAPGRGRALRGRPVAIRRPGLRAARRRSGHPHGRRRRGAQSRSTSASTSARSRASSPAWSGSTRVRAASSSLRRWRRPGRRRAGSARPGSIRRRRSRTTGAPSWPPSRCSPALRFPRPAFARPSSSGGAAATLSFFKMAVKGFGAASPNRAGAPASSTSTTW